MLFGLHLTYLDIVARDITHALESSFPSMCSSLQAFFEARALVFVIHGGPFYGTHYENLLVSTLQYVCTGVLVLLQVVCQ